MEIKLGFSWKHVKADRPIRKGSGKLCEAIEYKYLKFRGEARSSMYNTGVNAATKRKILQFLKVREPVKIQKKKIQK